MSDFTFIKVPHCAFASPKWRTMSASDKDVYLAIAQHVNNQTGIAYPGMDRIASLIGRTRRTVERSVDRLERSGLLRIVERGGGRGRSHKYRLELPGQEEAAPKTASGSARREGRATLDDTELTDEQKKLLTSDNPADIVHMRHYLRFGAAGVGVTDTAGLKSTQMDWQNHEGFSKDDMKLDKWTAQQFAGYYWILVMWYRLECDTHRKPMYLPPTFGRLIKDIKNLMRVRTNQQVYDRIRAVVRGWPVICAMAGRIGQTLELRHDTLSNPIVEEKLNLIMSYSDEWFEAQLDRVLAGKSLELE
jgi:DNA-binding MarR family transcriptional regulator